jgi:FkbM family methyltransferase
MAAATIVERMRGLRHTAQQLGSIAPHRRGRRLAWAATIGIPIKQRFPALNDRGFPLLVRLGDTIHRIAVRDRSEVIAAQQVLVEREYDVALARAPRTILDLGAHIGLSVMWFASVYPQARIIAVEPDPRNYLQLRRHTQHLPNVELVNAAVDATSGEGRLARFGFSWTSRLDDAGDTKVTKVTLDQLLERATGPILLKIDIEGAEWAVLRSVDPRRFDAIVGDFHKELVPVSRTEFLRLFRDFHVLSDGGDDVNSVLCAVAR